MSQREKDTELKKKIRKIHSLSKDEEHYQHCHRCGKVWHEVKCYDIYGNQYTAFEALQTGDDLLCESDL